MELNFENLDTWQLQSLLIGKNREFTDAMKMGKKRQELLPIYESIKTIYHELSQRKHEMSRQHAA